MPWSVKISHDLAAHATAAARSSRSWFIVVCWYEAINNLVEQLLRRTLETGETINVPDLGLGDHRKPC
jgi:hypothetical protein